jgi:hypothetical protein
VKNTVIAKFELTLPSGLAVVQLIKTDSGAISGSLSGGAMNARLAPTRNALDAWRWFDERCAELNALVRT